MAERVLAADFPRRLFARAVFVLQGMTRHEMNYIAKTALPMFLIMVLMVVVLVVWPELATWLPETARQSPGG